MSFHQDEFHQTKRKLKNIQDLILMNDGILQRIGKLEANVNKILDRDSEFWTDEE